MKKQRLKGHRKLAKSNVYMDIRLLIWKTIANSVNHLMRAMREKVSYVTLSIVQNVGKKPERMKT